MIALLQRVTEARVIVNQKIIGQIGPGTLAFIGVEREDCRADADRLVQRILAYRIFSDADGKMNLNLRQVEGGLLLVPQFTLAADTGSGNRPSFSRAAPPERGQQLFDYLVERARQTHEVTETGRFAAAMQVALVNDGPVTFSLRVPR